MNSFYSSLSNGKMELKEDYDEENGNEDDSVNSNDDHNNDDNDDIKINNVNLNEDVALFNLDETKIMIYYYE